MLHQLLFHPNALGLGRCQGATHLISGLMAGAFEFSAGGESQAGADVGVAGVGAGGSSASKREILRRDGDQASCAKATTSDPRPPSGCGALLKIELIPLSDERAPTPPSATHTAPEPAPPPTATSPPPGPGVPEPAACRAARVMRAEGRRSQYESLAAQCRAQGGAP